MADFTKSDFTKSDFTENDFSGNTFWHVRFNDAEIRGAPMHRARLIGVELFDAEITGDIEGLTINGVEIAPLVEAELDRRDPDRAKLRPDDPDGYREAFAIVERRWVDTIERARTLPPETLHRRVAGEWSFIETLRHLNFATAAWVGRMIVGDPSPWHPLDLPWDEAPGWDDIPWDRDVRPSLDEVLPVRAERQTLVRRVLDDLTDDQLASTISRTEPGWPQIEQFPFAECLRIVLNEEWEHRNFAERDLAVVALAQLREPSS